MKDQIVKEYGLDGKILVATLERFQRCKSYVKVTFLVTVQNFQGSTQWYETVNAENLEAAFESVVNVVEAKAV